MFPSGPIGEGYLRKDGRKGIRNKILILYTVECCEHVARKICGHFQGQSEQVDCIGAQLCLDNQVNIRRLLAFATHPNVGAVLVVGHGCEHNNANTIADFAMESGRPARFFSQQEAGGTRKSIALGIRYILELHAQMMKNVVRAPLYMKDLMFGGECGGSDFTSGLAGNPLVGFFFDCAIDAGATCVVEEIAESIGLKDYLVNRCVNEQAKREMADTYDKTEQMCKLSGQYWITPGNMHGGLTTIEEKSMGATAKSGSRPFQGVLKIAQQPMRQGLWLLDTIQDEHIETGLVCGGDATSMIEFITLGCHINFLVTGRGHVVGNPVAVTIKITGNARVFDHMSDDIDINAGKLINGEYSMEEMAMELYNYVVGICANERSKAEQLGHCEGQFYANFQSPDRVVGCANRKD